LFMSEAHLRFMPVPIQMDIARIMEQNLLLQSLQVALCSQSDKQSPLLLSRDSIKCDRTEIL
jgi:hypothetical protein